MMDIEGSSVPVFSLCLLAPPLRLMSAAMWKAMSQQDVSQYGRLEECITSICHSVPGLLDYRHYVKLVLGLRSRLILELCRDPEALATTAILTHLERLPALVQSAPNRPKRDLKVEMTLSNFENLVQTLLDDPEERELFYQEEFPKQYGAQYDRALEKLMWEFLSRLDQLLPVPDLAQTVSWLANAPAVLDECAKSATPPQLLRNLLQHELVLGHTGPGVSIPPRSGDDVYSTSLPPSGHIQETHQPGSDQTAGRSVPSPPRSYQQQQRQTSSPIDPVIGSISLMDIQSAVACAGLGEKGCHPELTSDCDVEPDAPAQGFTNIRQKTHSRPAEAAGEEEEHVRSENDRVRSENDPIRVHDCRVVRKRGRPRKGNALIDQADGAAMERTEKMVTSAMTQEEDRTSLLPSCLKRQPRVVLRRVDETKVTKQRDGGIADITQKRDVSILTSCTRRQLRVVIRRLDMSSPAIQVLLKRPLVAVPECQTQSPSTKTKGHVTVKKRKRKTKRVGRRSSSEKTLLGSENKENIEGLQIISQRTNSPVRALAAAESGEEMVADSEDESPNSFRLFLKRYYRTKHNTFVPTLEEFVMPRRRDLSPGTGQRQ
ncbi:TERF1-interacting nuclear factor 2 isoform X1 [Alosa pseudoharengus]|uniref:TERF1-interacting nuclear factor 2 isoform X1 n=1 Tax=Alosa pseudoharengus TaxID=34774 RepID=UPI003F8C2381